MTHIIIIKPQTTGLIRHFRIEIFRVEAVRVLWCENITLSVRQCWVIPFENPIALLAAKEVLVRKWFLPLRNL